MRILFLASPRSDFLQDLTWAGLAECLGSGAVAEVPRREDYHAPLAPYPFNQGFVPGPAAPESGLDEAGRGLRRGDFDAVVVGAAKAGPLASLRALRRRVPHLPPTLFVDGGDRREPGGDCPDQFREVERERPFDLILKRELHPGGTDPRLRPFPFSVNPRAFPEIPLQPRDLRVHFSARATSAVRRRAAALLRAAFPDVSGDLPDVAPWRPRRGPLRSLRRRLRRLTGRPDGGRDAYLDLAAAYRRTGAEYLRDLHRARVAVSLRGRGYDTFRYWEIPWCGALLVSEALPIVIPDNFHPGVEAVFVRPDLSDLCARIAHLLEHEDERVAIAAAGRALLLARHTCRARAERLLEWLRGLTSVRPRWGDARGRRGATPAGRWRAGRGS